MSGQSTTVVLTQAGADTWTGGTSAPQGSLLMYRYARPLPGYVAEANGAGQPLAYRLLAVDSEKPTLEETITVTGETPVVDVQSVRVQQTVSKDVLAAIPSSRSGGGIQALIPGMSSNGDSGGITGGGGSAIRAGLGAAGERVRQAGDERSPEPACAFPMNDGHTSGMAHGQVIGNLSGSVR